MAVAGFARTLALAWLALLVGVACGPESSSTLTGTGGAPAAQARASEQAPIGSTSSAWNAASAARQAAYVEAVQRQAPAEYDLERTVGGKVSGRNPAHGLAFQLDHGTLRLEWDEPGAEPMELRWTGIGRGDAVEPVPAPEGAGEVVDNQTRAGPRPTTDPEPSSSIRTERWA